MPVRTADEVRRAKERGGRVIAVGTTVVRALESSVDRAGKIIASRGWTDLVITPERGLRIVDALLTGLHEPRATHLAMLEALAGREHVTKAYAAALERKYLDQHRSVVGWARVQRGVGRSADDDPGGAG